MPSGPREKMILAKIAIENHPIPWYGWSQIGQQTLGAPEGTMNKQRHTGMALIASFKVLKGLLLLLLGLGLLKLVHADIATLFSQALEALRLNADSQILHALVLRVDALRPESVLMMSIVSLAIRTALAGHAEVCSCCSARYGRTDACPWIDAAYLWNTASGESHARGDARSQVDAIRANGRRRLRKTCRWTVLKGRA